MNSNGQVDTARKIADNTDGFGANLDNNDRFGSATAGLGDLNGDGFADIAVGAPFDDDGGDNRGAVWILFMNADGSVAASQKISDRQGGFTGDLSNDDHFGNAVAGVGDLDGDGISELAVGAELANVNGTRKGAVWILFMNADGTVRSSRQISQGEGDFKASLNADDQFGSAVAGLGDLDGDGIPDLAVGADHNDTGGADRGAVWILFMKSDGKVKDERRIASGEGDFAGVLGDGSQFGRAIAEIGDVDSDGVIDLAVGADLDDDGGTDRGAVWLLLMKTNGKVNREVKISATQGKFDQNLDNGDGFGAALAGLGNLNNNKSTDFAATTIKSTPAPSTWFSWGARKTNSARTSSLPTERASCLTGRGLRAFARAFGGLRALMIPCQQQVDGRHYEQREQRADTETRGDCQADVETADRARARGQQ
jgi:hypothetical protein